MHRDLKPQNLLIDAAGTLKICDFGLARGFGIPIKNLAHEVVTLWYRPPDVLLGSTKYTANVDTWSIGCIFAEMANQKSLFPGTNEEDQLLQIFKKCGSPSEESFPGLPSLPLYDPAQIPTFPGVPLKQLVPKLEETGLDLLSQFLQIDPDKRITAANALKHPYFADLPEFVHKLYQ